MAKIHCTHCGGENEGTIVQRFLEDPAQVLDQTRVMELARAIQQGQMDEAAVCLDVLFRDDESVREWIDQARVIGRRRG